mmetsp:Transcript_24157/g.56989  ORF Transcript_24157/g.56989 Transcript_24157/m.56989 type:complete len:134 (-) Transcript_24157:222-623(-)
MNPSVPQKSSRFGGLAETNSFSRVTRCPTAIVQGSFHHEGFCFLRHLCFVHVVSFFSYCILYKLRFVVWSSAAQLKRTRGIISNRLTTRGGSPLPYIAFIRATYTHTHTSMGTTPVPRAFRTTPFGISRFVVW